MAINLTEGAVSLICTGAVKSAEDMSLVLQVTDLKPLATQNQQSNTERFRLLLSDGSQQQQGMLATQKNDLVNSGKLQTGSIVKLTQFTCSFIQNRMIVIIVDLEVMLEKCDIIGQPEVPTRTAASIPSTNQQGPVTGNPQSYGSSSVTGGHVTRPNIAGAALQHHGMDQSRGPYTSNANSGRYATNTPPMYPTAAFAAVPTVSAQSSVSYNQQNMGFQNPRAEGTRPPLNTFSRPPQSSYQQPPPLYVNRGSVAKNDAAPRIIPIAALNPYQVRWTIKARVTVKSDLRHYSNTRGDGKVFSFDLLDSDGGEIRVTCFNAVADQFYNQIEAGKVYVISKGSLKPAQKNFNHLRNDHEIFLDSASTVQPCPDDDSAIPQQQFFFRPISEIEGMNNNSVVDIIGVVSVISPAVSIIRKNGTEAQKRTLHLKDMSGRSVEVTLWGNFCNAEGQTLQAMCDSGRFPVLAMKAARVNDFNGKTVGSISNSQLFVEPDFPEAHKLREWFAGEGKSTASVSISREASSMGSTDVRKTLSQIKDEKLGTSEKPDWITVSATVSFIKSDSFCYTACPIKLADRQCSKKVTNNGDGKWTCDRCDKSVDQCDYRYILQFQIQDHTGMAWVTAFQECGEEIMGISAKDLYFMRYEEQEDEKFAEVIRKVLFTKYIFKLKVKEETFGDEQRVKSNVVKAERVDFSSESKFLLDMVGKLKAGVSGSPAMKPQILIPNSGTGSVGNRQIPQSASRYSVNNNNQAVQYGNQYNGLRPQAPDTSGPYIQCNSCGGTGHSSTNCPSIDSGPSMGGGYSGQASSGVASGGNSRECYKCHQPGHWAANCPSIDSGSSMGGGYSGRASSGIASGGNSSECYKCHQPGHWAANCPSIDSGSSMGGDYSGRPSSGVASGGNSSDCYKCHQPGHWAKDCPQMNNIPPAYGSGTYGGASNQRIGGF